VSGERQRQPEVALFVYHRAAWQCQMPECLCPDGRKIDRRLRGTNDLWEPSIDHIKPLAAGGADTLRNKRAAHRECNRAAAELQLQGAARGRPAPEPLTSSIGDLYPDLAKRLGL
jgi:5-methylcytosine-specific restriction endonuclease McrA